MVHSPLLEEAEEEKAEVGVGGREKHRREEDLISCVGRTLYLTVLLSFVMKLCRS